MFYMYVLRSEVDQSYYVGSTNNLKRRFDEHNSGRSIYTKKLIPWKLIYYESYSTYKLAYNREFALKKRAKAWQELIKRI